MTDTCVHICAPEVTDRAIATGICPDCKTRTRMLQFHQDWVGWHSTCLRCGRQWDGGEWLALDFRRGVRADNIKRAKARWRALSRAKKRIAETPHLESLIDTMPDEEWLSDEPDDWKIEAGKK